jgi:hypothetical protein
MGRLAAARSALAGCAVGGHYFESIETPRETDERLEAAIGNEGEPEAASFRRGDRSVSDCSRFELDRATRPGPAAVIDDPDAAERDVITRARMVSLDRE